MAYNYSHVIGLTLFGSTVRVVSKVSELFESFKVSARYVLLIMVTYLLTALCLSSKRNMSMTQLHLAVQRFMMLWSMLMTSWMNLVLNTLIVLSKLHGLFNCIDYIHWSKHIFCRRVLALTDGADNESRNTAVVAAQKLQVALFVY